MVQRTTHPPRYSEAFPRVSMGEALRGRKVGKPDVLWRNRLGHAVGFATLDSPEPDTIVMSFHLQDLPYVDGADGDVEIAVEYKGSTQSNLRPFAVFKECCRHIDVIIFAGTEWLCKTCLCLSNRSTLIDPVVRITEELEDIEQSIGEGRPNGMRVTRFEMLQQRHDDLLAQLRGKPRRGASRDYQARIDAEWLPRSSFVIGHLGGEWHEGR